MATTISLINMKGGVGKTTLATQLAWYATYFLDKKVLLVDLDPQANVSQAVMNPQGYVNWLNQGKPTVVDLFEEFTPTGSASNSPKKLDPANLIFRRVKYQQDGSLLDLVPSRLELSWSLRNPAGKENLLARFIAKVEADYDLVFIDCAPTDSMLTDAAYLSSRYILVPMRAEFLAAIGFPLLSRSIDAFKIRHENHAIDICGLVFNDYRENRESRLARADVEKNAAKFGWYIFANEVPHSDSYPRSAREGMPINQTKGTHSKTKEDFTLFADEFFLRIGV
ncbi:MAG: ParA family protein [Polyangiaceae bacterium]